LLKNEPFLTKFRHDTAENGPSELEPLIMSAIWPASISKYDTPVGKKKKMKINLFKQGHILAEKQGK
jgi:hypothetical protein